MTIRVIFRALAPLVVMSGFMAGVLSHAQSTILDLPRQSQHALLTQRIGITDVTISYHRPLAGSRKIWGGVVPYGQPWRAGANENTTIQFKIGRASCRERVYIWKEAV